MKFESITDYNEPNWEKRTLKENDNFQFKDWNQSILIAYQRLVVMTRADDVF